MLLARRTWIYTVYIYIYIYMGWHDELQESNTRQKRSVLGASNNVASTVFQFVVALYI